MSKSTLTRRALVASTAAMSAAAALPIAVQAATEPDPALIGDTSRVACIARAEHIVALLDDCYIREGWHEAFDRQGAARFLESVRTFDEHDGDDPRFTEILEWTRDHGQSLDWLFQGDVRGMVAGQAKNSAVAQLAAGPDPIFAVIKDCRQACAQHGAAIDATYALPGDWNEETGPSPLDHPEWGALEAAVDQACHRQSEAARKLCHTAPTTLAGIAALLNFVIEAHESGDNILNIFADDNKECPSYERDTCMWPFFKSVLRSVEQMARAQS